MDQPSPNLPASTKELRQIQVLYKTAPPPPPPNNKKRKNEKGKKNEEKQGKKWRRTLILTQTLTKSDESFVENILFHFFLKAVLT